MDCEQFGEMLDNYENLSKEEQLKLAEHSAKCESCRAELDFMNAVLNVTKSLPSIEPNSDFREKLNARLDKECAKKHSFRLIDWKKYGSVAACLLLAVIVGVNGRSLVSRINDDGNGIISETVITSGNNGNADAAAEAAEQPGIALPIQSTAPDAAPKPLPTASAKPLQSSAPVQTPSVSKRAEPDSSVSTDNTAAAGNYAYGGTVGRKSESQQSEPGNDISDKAAAEQAEPSENTASAATPVPSTEPYTIEKNKYRIPEESSAEPVAVNDAPEQKDDGYLLSSGGKGTSGTSVARSMSVTEKEIESAIPGSTVVVNSINEEQARAIISNYIVGTYGTYYMTTEDEFYRIFDEFDKAGIRYEKYVGSASDKISFRLVVIQ